MTKDQQKIYRFGRAELGWSESAAATDPTGRTPLFGPTLPGGMKTPPEKVIAMDYRPHCPPIQPAG